MNLDALTDEVLARCDALGACSDDPDRLTRAFLSPATWQAQNLVAGWMADAGLTVRRDAVGNVIGHKAGAGSRVFLVGSHIDTVPDAGRYDGPLGVLLGIAAAKALADRQFAVGLDVLAFSEEEGVRFRTPYLGSAAVAGCFDPDWLALADADGTTVADALREFDLDAAGIPRAAYSSVDAAGYLEVHIEQGPVLEAKSLALGVVTAIVGQSRLWFTFTGEAGHAGTQPMELRRDALAGAAEFISSVESTTRATNGLRATVGSLVVSPGATNVIPGEVRLSLDVRHADDHQREVAVGRVIVIAQATAKRRGIAVTIEPFLDQPAVPCDESMSGRLAAALTAGGHPVEWLPSGAGHDAVMMARLCPVAMLFIRSPGGISHSPAESVRREDVRAALEVLIRILDQELATK